MATLQVQDRSMVYKTSKFLGLNESSDGPTSLKNGEAAKMVNFLITESYHLKTRYGYKVLNETRGDDIISFLYNGYLDGENVCIYGNKNKIFKLNDDGASYELLSQNIPVELDHPCFSFGFDNAVYILTGQTMLRYRTEDGIQEVDGYVPTVLILADPSSGAGTEYEGINLLTKKRKVSYSVPDSAEGGVSEFKILETASSVESVVSSVEDLEYIFTFDEKRNVVVLETPVSAGSGIIISYTAKFPLDSSDRESILKMKYAETYNGSTDSRVFLYGDGSNVTYYSGVTAAGKATAEYFPSLNEIAVDSDNSPITAMIRHFSRMLVYKPDGVFTVSYDAMTTAEGDTIAGFYLRPMNRDIGNEMPGQVRQVYNYPRSLSHDMLYDWKQSASFYRDERYAKIVSERVQQTLKNVVPEKCVCFDDMTTNEYLLFMNDEEGTVLVNNYSLDVWYKYTGFKNIAHITRFSGMRLIGTTDGQLLDWSERWATDNGKDIESVWNSAFLDFGMSYMRKNAAEVWVAIKPSSDAEVEVTAKTDRRINNTVKSVVSRLATFWDASFARWSFNTNRTPKVKRVKIKTKKFVYYQICLRTVGRMSGVTVIEMNHKIRFTSQKK